MKHILLIVIALMAITLLSSSPYTAGTPEYDAYKLSLINQFGSTTQVINSTPAGNAGKDAPALLIPLDETFTLAMAPNDDGSSSLINLGFTFSLYGEPYTTCYINNNGNITFDGPSSTFTAFPFPISGYPMLAAFFADVDTRGTGAVYYRIESNRMIVIWDHVGYYQNQTDKVNTFQIIMTNGTDPLIGLGNNVCFSYADMQWTTGSASGGSGGFGGSAATVGINKGDQLTYIQSGRFDQAGDLYDGGDGNNDGVDWLDDKDLYLQAAGAATLIVTPTIDVAGIIGGAGMPGGLDVTDPTVSAFYATYPIAGTQTVNVAVGAGEWRGWIYYTGAWHQADVFPYIAGIGGGTVVFSNVPFTGGKENLPIILQSGDATLPVELSIFNAVLTAQNYVKLSWISESETNMLGYRVYRSENAEQASATMITPILIEATNTSSTASYSLEDREVNSGNTYYYWLEAVDFGSSQFFGPQSVVVNGDVTPDLPTQSAMKNAYPNPFKASGNTNIEVSIKAGESGNVAIYNVTGQLVQSFQVSEGSHNLVWNGRDSKNNACGSGIYFYKMSTPSMNQTRKLVIIK